MWVGFEEYIYLRMRVGYDAIAQLLILSEKRVAVQCWRSATETPMGSENDYVA